MTREEVINVLYCMRGMMATCYQLTPQRKEALDLAIEALRGEPAAAQRDQLLKEVEELRKELQVCQHLNQTLYRQATACEEAVKAMEREGGLLKDSLDERKFRLEVCHKTIDKLRTVLEEKESSYETSHSSRLFADQRVLELQAELSDLLEKIKEFVAFANVGKHAACLQPSYRAFWSGVCGKLSELFPSPEPAPEPQMWAWALEELKAGRKATDGKIVIRRSPVVEGFEYRSVDVALWARWWPILEDFTEAKWLPCEKEKWNE